ncbi:protein kinase-like domain-containing protein [Artemisia annua]|uniref:Protein kinase-like domain-containing protein n=1 Tax=Artemisia annua TaxID=35608 RepID=A0A2U1NN20_ARTAN|nr:protein kinase-like domain-containing protein [Artemisia annua]
MIETLSNCEHRNIESFLGFCDEGPETFLVFEYVSGNYIEDCLFDCTLTWKKSLEICVDIAHGLDYLHSKMEDQKRVIHSYIRVQTIVLNDNGQAMIVGLENAIFLLPNQDDGANYQMENLYTDPEYDKTDKLTIKSDVHSFGAFMLGILSGKIYWNRSDESLIQKWMDKEKIKEDMLPTIKEDNIENNSFLCKGPNEDSLEVFLKVAYQCLAETQNERPSMETVIKELKRALSFQENHKDPLRMPFEDIKLATKDFCNENVIGGGGFGRVYKGEVAHGLDNGNRIIVAKRLDTRGGQGEKQYYDELQILYEFKHENVIGLVGYSNEKHERVIVYEYAPRGSLDKYLNDDKLSWRMRLQICIDVASGLAFLHGGVQGKEMVIHRDIKAANILLFDDWKAKVADFGLSLISTINEKTDYTIDHPCGTRGYIDPLYEKSGFLTIESDIYSFGVVLFEIMYGRPMYAIHKQKGQSLPNFIRQIFKENKQDELVFEAIKEHIVPKSLTTFQTIAYKCLHEDREKRPTSKEILEQLKMALEFQEENKM